MSQQNELLKTIEEIGLASNTFVAEISKLTEKDRRQLYGTPQKNFRNVADFWELWFSMKKEPDLVLPTDIPILMILMKIAREANAHSRDNLLDIAGYAKTLDELHGGK